MVLPLRFGRAPPSRRPRIEGAENGSLLVKGDIDGGEALVIDARVIGDVTAGRISISADAVVHGTVQGRSVEIAGTVHGAIVASDVQLEAGAVVHGRIEHLSLSVAATADFQGESIRRAAEGAAALAEWADELGAEVHAGDGEAGGEAQALAG
jgi:cytoskeletal protein CcmA (bactofilin family)